MSGPEDHLTVAEAAQLTGRSPATIRSWHHRGLLPLAGTTASRQGSPSNTYRRADVLQAWKATGQRNARRAPRRETTGDAWDPTARLLTAKEAIDTVGITWPTLARWIDSGKLTPVPHDQLMFLEVDVLDADREARRADPRSRPKG